MVYSPIAAANLYVVRVRTPDGHDIDAGFDGIADAAEAVAACRAVASALVGGPETDDPEEVWDVLDTLAVLGAEPADCVAEVVVRAAATPETPHGWRTVLEWQAAPGWRR